MKFTTISERPADSRRARRLLFAAALGVLAGAFSSMGQSMLAIGFEGPPNLPAGTGQTTATYSEFGVQFSLVGVHAPWGGVSRFASGYVSQPDNGSTFLIGAQGTTNSHQFAFLDGSVFQLQAVDLAEYFFSTTPTTVRFVGYRHDGTMVVTDLTTDGINDSIGPQADFQTFHFGPEFSGLDRVEIPSHGWSLDNLVVLIPEPSSLVLLAGGGLFAVACALRSKRRTQPGQTN